MDPFENSTSEHAASAEETGARLSVGVILRRLVVSILAWSIHAGITWILLFVYGPITSEVRKDVEEFELGVPEIAEFVFGLASTISSNSTLLILALVVIDGPIAAAVCYLPLGRKWLGWVWFISYLLIAIVLLALASVVLPVTLIRVAGPLMTEP